MPKAAMPTGNDLRKLCMASGLIDSPMTVDQTLVDTDQAAAAAITQWENRTLYHPFLAAATDVTRYYDPPESYKRDSRAVSRLGLSGSSYGLSRGGGANLYFSGGYLSVTSLTINIDPLSLPAGLLLTANKDYWLMPTNAANDVKPYRYIQFVQGVYGLPASIVIVGKAGFSATVPDDVWTAVLYLGMLELLPSLELLRTRGVSEIRQGPISMKYGTAKSSPYAAQYEMWNAHVKMALGKYGIKDMY